MQHTKFIHADDHKRYIVLYAKSLKELLNSKAASIEASYSQSVTLYQNPRHKNLSKVGKYPNEQKLIIWLIIINKLLFAYFN